MCVKTICSLHIIGKTEQASLFRQPVRQNSGINFFHFNLTVREEKGNYFPVIVPMCSPHPSSVRKTSCPVKLVALIIAASLAAAIRSTLHDGWLPAKGQTSLSLAFLIFLSLTANEIATYIFIRRIVHENLTPSILYLAWNSSVTCSCVFQETLFLACLFFCPVSTQGFPPSVAGWLG